MVDYAPMSSAKSKADKSTNGSGGPSMTSASVAELMPSSKFQRTVAITLDRHAEKLAEMAADFVCTIDNLKAQREFMADMSVRLDELTQEVRALKLLVEGNLHG